MSALSEELTRLSSLTLVQVDTLKIQELIRKDAINRGDALKLRKAEGISRGTYYRILSQAKKNMRESLFTLVLGVQLGLIRAEDVERLLSTTSRIPSGVEEERIPEIVTLIRILIERIVM